MPWQAKEKRQRKIDAFLDSAEGVPYLMYARKDRGLAGWLACVDAWLQNHLGLEFGDVDARQLYDGQSYDWKAAYENGLEPTVAAMNACPQEWLDQVKLTSNDS